MRRTIIAGNWKMNKLFPEVEDFLFELSENLEAKDLGKIDVIICPPSLYMEIATDVAVDSKFYIGAQNVNDKDLGAYTGEISACMLDSMDIDYCIIGHSERREYYSETNEMINAKVKRLQENAIVPIICVGETLEQREQGITQDVILEQLNGAFKDIRIEENVIIAYEPVWAIGTGKTATPEQAQEVHFLIRNWIRENYSPLTADNLSILYGGSMKPANTAELLMQPDIDGGLIGGSSLDISQFTQMIDTALNIK
ncbi:MAG: triose-phosphate isomerase [Candidatus Cloacimonetes bacterium]|nr:triose-phosphate isomerase [Candidatus Cloacimonadota bacterium]